MPRWNTKSERRDKKRNKNRFGDLLHGKGMKRIENDLEFSVRPGVTFSDVEKHRELKVIRKHDYQAGYWWCEMTNSNIEVLHSYKEDFIKKHMHTS